MLNFKARINNLRQKMAAEKMEAFLVTHQPNVFYLSGFSGSSGFLLVTLQDVFLCTDFRYLQQGREEAPCCEIVKVRNAFDFSFLAELLASKNIETLALEEAHLSLRGYHCLLNSLDGIRTVPVLNFIEELRAVKTEEEINLVARAARLADEALRDTLPLLKAGMRERDVAVELEYRLRKGGSEKIPFEIIVASGLRSALPHGVASLKEIKEGEFVVIDFGAVYGGYSSDMTRTFVMGMPSQKQEEIYHLVLAGQELALQSLKPGQSCAGIDALVRNFFRQNGYDAYFGHGLGHGVGLEVHELPVLSPAGKQVLQEGMIFTVEPGIYLEGWGGVRIEDLVVMGPHEPQILSNADKNLISLS